MDNYNAAVTQIDDASKKAQVSLHCVSYVGGLNQTIMLWRAFVNPLDSCIAFGSTEHLGPNECSVLGSC